MARLSIFGCWMFVTNDGKYDPILVLAGYYSVFLVLLLFNFIFNSERITLEGHYWIGTAHISIIIRFLYLHAIGIEYQQPTLGLILNSLSCVLSYNYYDYKALLKVGKSRQIGQMKEGKGKVLHESTLVRQSLYFCLYFLLLLCLTVATLLRLRLVTTQDLSLLDHNNNRRVLGVTFCYKLLGIGWASFFLAWIINICLYAIHPSRGF